ncbi:MAG: caspase family protein [Lewinellaceae bacterium]|nr:caspase family protein [Lewinellaceae bacterium]
MKTIFLSLSLLSALTLWGQSLQLIVPTGHTNKVYSVTFSPDSQFALTASEDNTAKLWDLKTGRELQSFVGHGRTVRFAKFSVDGKFVITSGYDGTTRRWDLYGNILDTLKGISEVEYFEGSHGLKDSLYGSVVTIEDSTGRFFQTLQGYAVPVAVAEFSPDGQQILIKSTRKAEDWQQYWDLNKGVLMNYQGHPFGPPFIRDALSQVARSPREVILSPDRNMTLRRQREAVLFTNNNNGSTLRLSTEPPFRGASCVAFSPDGKTILAGTTENEAIRWDTSGRQLATFKGHTLWLSSVAASPDNKFLVTSSLDRTIKLWDTTGTLLATLITVDSNNWVVTTPNGLFDASPGAMHHLYYVFDLEIYELEQLKERYYEPGLLPKVLGYTPGGLRKVDALEKMVLQPPKISKVSDQGAKRNVQLIERNGGIGPVVLLLNGNIELDKNVNPENKTEFTLDLGRYARYFIPDSANHLSLRAYNQDGWLRGPNYDFQYFPEKTGSKNAGDTDTANKPVSLRAQRDAPLEAISFYALVVGTSEYSNDGLSRLKYADKDAEAFAEALSATSTQLFGNVEIKVLTTNREPWPRKAEIQQALEDFARKAKPDDVLLVYFSGHGTAYPPNSEKGQFYYLTVDISSGNLGDPVVLNTRAVAQDSLEFWINQIVARKRILILDACNSGKAIGAKDLGNDQRRALEQLKDKSGMFVLAGSASDQFSYESDRFRHSLLTYSLLNNMPLVAAEHQKNIDVSHLFNKTLDNVEQLARQIGEEQQPKMIGNGGFAIGRIDGALPYKVPQALPVVIRTNFVNQKIKDVVHLSREVNRYFDNLSAKTTPLLAFSDVAEYYGDHYYLSGKYTLTDGKIAGEAYLYYNDDEVVNFPFSSAADELGKLTKFIFDEVAKHIKVPEMPSEKR